MIPAAIVVMSSVSAWVIASGAGDSWPTWVVLPTNLGAVGLLLWLQLTGRQMRREDADAMVAAERARGDERVTECTARTAEREAELGRREAMLTDRLDAVVADRNAWREAHHQEVEARRTAEASTVKLLSATDVTVRLLDALERSVVANHPPAG